MYTMGDEDKSDYLDEKEFRKLWDYYEHDWKSAQGADGEWDMKQVFHDEDYNSNGFLEEIEIINANKLTPSL